MTTWSYLQEVCKTSFNNSGGDSPHQNKIKPSSQRMSGHAWFPVITVEANL